MTKDINKIRDRIDEIKVLLDMSYYCQGDENKRKLLEEFDRLSYHYYKTAVSQMKNMGGDGDGI